MLVGPTGGIGEKLFCNQLVDVELAVLSLPLLLCAFGFIGPFKLMIACSLFQEIFDHRECIENRRRIVADHSLLPIEVVAWLEFESCLALRVDTDKVDAIR